MAKTPSKLFKLKKWLTITEAAKHLSILFEEEVSEADVLRLCLDGRLKLSIYFPKIQFAKLTKIELLNLSDFPEYETENVMIDIVDVETLSTISDEIHYLEGIFDVPMIFGNRRQIERNYLALLGKSSVEEGYGELIVERDARYFELYTKFSEESLSPISSQQDGNYSIDYVKRESAKLDYACALNFPEDSLFVVRTESLQAFKSSLNDSTSNSDELDPRERNTMLKIIAALLELSECDDYNGAGRSRTVKDIRTKADFLGLSIQKSETIEKYLRLVSDLHKTPEK
jgi:hypothetical protein